MKKPNVALFCREDSAYKERPSWDVYDINRDAMSYDGTNPVVCHPPCRSWGRLSHMANPREGEKDLAIYSIQLIRNVGGILEHPHGSRLFNRLPLSNGFSDEYGGFTLELNQYDFGHVAHKNTKLYIVGIDRGELPVMPDKNTNVSSRSICGNVAGTTRCTQYQREYTPERLIDFFEEILGKIRANKNKEISNV